MLAFDSLMNSVREAARRGNILDQFGELSTDAERVEYVMRLAALQNIVPEDRFCGKNDAQAQELREQGDRISLEEDPWQAVRLYTSAVKLAPAGSAVLAHSLLARGRALHRAGSYAEAAEDARSSADGQLSPLEVITATQLEAECQRQLGQHAQAETTFHRALQLLRASTLHNETKARLTGELAAALKKTKQEDGKGHKTRRTYEVPAVDYGRNPLLPAASGALKLRWTADKGRHVVATRDINLGSVLIVEQPYAWSLSTEGMAEHCLNCCRLSRAPLPCIQCATVSYCSLQCRDTAWQEFHQFECRVLDHMTHSQDLSKMALLSYRIVVIARLGGLTHDPHNASNESMSKLADSKQVQQCNKMEKHPENTGQVFLSSAYSSVYGQLTHSNRRTPADLLKRAVSAVFLTKCLRHASGTEIDDLTLATAIIRHLQSCSCNAYQISEQVVRDGDTRTAIDTELGGAVYPTISLCNHSCNPNVARHSHGSICVVRSSRKIKKDEEILDNYGPHYLVNPVDERRLQLKLQYFFNCTCEPCISNWPTAIELQKSVTWFKCVHCSQELSTDLVAVKNCPRCKRKLEYRKLQQKIQNVSQDFKDALEKFLAGCVEDCLKLSLECAMILEPVVVHPNAEFVRWQQIITQCWSLLANIKNNPSK